MTIPTIQGPINGGFRQNREVRWIEPVQSSDDDGLGPYLIRLHPSFAESPHSWAREWSEWPQISLTHLPDQVKSEVIVLEERPNHKPLNEDDTGTDPTQ